MGASMFCQRCGNALGPGARFCNQCGTPVPAQAPAIQPAKGSSAAPVAIIVIVVVLGAVAVLGIIAAIAIPNLLTATERAKQVRTISIMRNAAMWVESERASHDALPDSMPARKDAWGHDLRYVSDKTNYWIVSAGKDGRFEEDDVTRYTQGATTSFDDDLVMENSAMRRWPRR